MFHESGWISIDIADQAKSECKAFVNAQAMVTKFVTFNIHSDKIYMVLCKLMQSRTYLLEAIKLCFLTEILSVAFRQMSRF